MKKTKVNLNWSDYQKEIFRDIQKGSGNTIIIARAGSAKSTTIIEGSKYVQKGKKILFCAFNKSIQEELKSKLPSHVECYTLHSLGFRAVKQRFGNVELDNYKCWKIVESFFQNPYDNHDLIDNICKTVGFCKANLVDTPTKIEDIIFQYEIDLCDTDMLEFVKYVCLALRLCKEKTDTIDYNDMIYFPFVYRLNVGKYDHIFIDETHDLTRAQLELALSAVAADGRVIAVLDNFQVIYSWAGADINILEVLRERLKPKELMLPICYRCPIKVIDEAKKYVDDIQVYDKAIDGVVKNIDMNEFYKLVKPNSYVLSRFNAPLIKVCMTLLKKGIPANMLGRDIGNNLLSLVKRSKKKTIVDFIKWLNNWEKQEKLKLLAKYPKSNTDAITDKVECLQNLCQDAKTLNEVKNSIDNLFKDNDEKRIVLCSSVHKNKGKESDIVFVLADTLREFSQEEKNICYISITRSKKELYFVHKKLSSDLAS